MKVVFFHSDNPREANVARSFGDGVIRVGDEFEMRRMALYERPGDDYDVACMMAVKGKSRQCFDEHKDSGIDFLYFDKGYARVKQTKSDIQMHYRISINDFQPHAYFQRKKRDDKRFSDLGYEIESRRNGEFVVFAGSSQKYCNWFDLGDATKYAKSVICEIKKYTDRPVIYRPKPSWKGAVPIDGTIFSSGEMRIRDVLMNSHIIVTHGSNSAMDAVLCGVPALTLGPSIAKPVSEQNMCNIENPYFPKDKTRKQWLHDLSYCHWTIDEMKTGSTWKHLRREIPYAR